MVEIQYAKLNQEMQENVAGWLYTESNLLPSDDSSGLYPSVRMLITNNAPPNYITFDGDGIDLDNLDKQFYSEGDYVGFISSNITDENCQGSSANDSIYLNYNDGYLNFDNGITISFYGDCCREITVQYIFPDKWFEGNDNQLCIVCYTQSGVLTATDQYINISVTGRWKEISVDGEIE